MGKLNIITWVLVKVTNRRREEVGEERKGRITKLTAIFEDEERDHKLKNADSL